MPLLLIFNVANIICLNTIHENKILSEISEFTVDLMVNFFSFS